MRWFSDINQMQKVQTMHASEGFLIRVSLLSHLGVAVQLVGEPHNERLAESHRAQDVTASRFCDDSRESQVPFLSETRKRELLKSIAEAIKKTWEAKHSDETASPISGLIGYEISPFPGTIGGAS